MSDLSAAEVSRLAQLARIDLTQAEVETIAGQLDHILDAVQQIAAVAGDDVPATSHPIPLTNVFRPDVVTPSLGAEAALAGAPAAMDDRFQVPRILDEE